MTRLVGKRVTLREYFISDSESIHRWQNDTKTTVWLGRKFRTPRTLVEIRERLTRLLQEPPKDGLFLAIAEQTTLRYIGGIDLTSIDWIDRNAVLSLVVGSESDRNRGYATEAIELLLKYAFEEMKLHRISLNVHGKNAAAIRCYTKNGFQVEGRRRDEVFSEGEYSDLIQMGILETEYVRK